MDNVRIPILNSSELVSIPVSQLPADCEEVLGLLKAEEVSLSIWLDIAMAYLSRGLAGQYVRILQEASSKEAAEFFGDGFKHERVQALCALAGHDIASAGMAKEPGRREEFLASAANHVSRARQLDSREQLPFLLSGMLAMAKGDFASGKRDFEVALKKKNGGRENIAAFLALASALFREGKYREALAYYKHALSLHPDCPAEVRIGIGACCFKLGKFANAATAYGRALQIDPNCTEALRGLATLSFNDEDRIRGLQQGAQCLAQAYQLEPEHPATLNLLAHLCLVRGNHKKAELLSSAAFELGSDTACRAESLSMLSRAYHAQGQNVKAMQHYLQACQLDAKLPLPHYGLAQLYLQQGEDKNAITELEAVMKIVPGSVDALKILAHLYPQLPTKAGEKVGLLKDAAARHHQDAEVWGLLGELLAPLDPAASLNAFKKGLELAREPGVQLMNNAAVMFYRAGDVPKALALMEEASRIHNSHDSEQLDGLPGGWNHVTLAFNLARLQEASGIASDAQRGYERIIEDFPEYMDCYIRLAYLAQRAGNMKEAMKWAEKATSVNGDHTDITLLLAALHTEQKNWYKAKQLLDKLIKGGKCQNDAYALLAMATLNMCSAPGDRRREGDEKKARQHFLKGLEYYQKALEKDMSNVYAANGMGAALAEIGQLEAAKEIFTEVQEAAASQSGFLKIPDVWVNLANLHLGCGDHDSAIKLYQGALAKFYQHQNPALLVYLARAYYDKGELKEAKKALLKAMHTMPDDPSLQFNVALTVQEHGWRTLTRKGPNGEAHQVEEFTQATEELSMALRHFSSLRKAGVEKTGINETKLNSHVHFCVESMKKAKAILEDATKKRQALDAEKARKKAQLEEQLERRRLAAEEKRRAEEAEDRDRQRRAHEHAKRLETLKEKWREEERLKEAARRGDASRIGRKRRAGGEEGERQDRKRLSQEASDASDSPFDELP